MENPTLDLIYSHGSVRHYRPDPVPDAIIEKVISAAQRTSTSSNLQAYSVVAVRDGEKKNKLADLCGNQKHIAEAPLFLAWCADLSRLDSVCKMRGYTQEAGYLENFLISAVDAAIAAQTAALAAESLGLGICYIGSIRNNPKGVIDLLNLPRMVFPVTGMTMGYSKNPARVRPRLPLNAVLHYERYNAEQTSALKEYDKTMASTGIYENRQVPTPGKPEVMEEYGWLEHTARRVSKAMRTGLSNVIKDQGFDLK